MKSSALLLPILLAASSLRISAQPAPQAPPPPCDPADQRFVCGQQAPEDIIGLPNGAWVFASNYSGTGGISLIETRTRKSTNIFPSRAVKTQLDRTKYPDCPGPPAGEFTTHGLYLEPGRAPVLQLMAVGHGARESIEVLTVDTTTATPTVTWIGCVIATGNIGLNSVRGLPDGGFITTNWLSRGGEQGAMQRMMGGERNGELWEWHTKSGWQKLPGSEAAGANGVELSEDGKTIYMAAWGSQSFIRLSRGTTPPKRDEVPLGFRVDNIHFARDGSLFAAGQVTDPGAPRVSKIVKIDTKTLAITEVLSRPDDAEFSGGTTAIEIGDDLWVGSYRGDRLAILPAP